MIKISARIQNLAESATIAVSNRSAQMRSEGIDVLSLGAGEPDFDTPSHIVDCVIEAIRAGKTKYAKPASGTPVVKNAIIEKLRSQNGLEYDPSQIVVTVGGKEALWLAFASILDPGDEVIVPAPYWVSYPEQVRLVGGVPVFVEAGVSQEFKITSQQLESALSPKTRAFVFNSPSNPSGTAYTPEETIALAQVLESRDDVVVFSDEIYEHFLYGGATFKSFASISPHAYDHTLTFNSASKTYSMTGWRIGFAAGPVELIRSMGKLQSQTTSGGAAFTMDALAEALSADQQCVEDMRKEFERRGEYLYERLNSMTGVVSPKPAGAFYVFPDVSGTYSGLGVSGSVEWATRLLEEAHLALVPGSAFGLDSCVRLSFATSMENLAEGLGRMERFLGSA